LIDVLRASPLLGSGRKIRLDGGDAGGEHDSGSSPMRDLLDPSTYRDDTALGEPF
jgi:hypothetical protein